MSSLKKMGAMESMFDPEQTTAALLEAVKVNVATTVKTVDAAATLENKLSEEAAQFNACLTTMSNAIRKCERGEISREEMLAECAPCVTALKEKCVALTLANVKTTGDDITEEEIAMLREYIVGCKDIVADRKRELQDCPTACEGLLAGLANFEPATEAANAATEIRKSTEAKTANELYKQAKKMYGLGSKEKAIEYLKKAQKLYENCLKKAEKAGKMYEFERTVKLSKSDKYNQSGVEDKFKKKVTENASMAQVIDYFEDRIDSCKALEMQWSNKAGKSTYKETKAQLKAERKETRKQNRLNAAKERAGKKAELKAKYGIKKAEYDAKFKNKFKKKMADAGTNEEREAVESMFELMYATESFADELLMDYDLSYALEAEGDEGDVAAVSENEQKLRDLYTQFNEAKAAGDEAKMNQLLGDIQKVLDAINKEAQDAYTEEDLKAADRKLAKAMAIGAAVLASAAAIGVGIKTGTFNKVIEAAKAQAAKLKSNKGENKGDTAKGKGLVNNLKTAIAGMKGKIAGAKSKSPADEAMIDGMTYEDFEASMESYMDSLEFELAMGAAMEADGEDGAEAEAEDTPKSASGIAARFRAAFAKLKKAKVEDDATAAAAAEREVAEVAAELEEAVDEAETPEEKKKLSTAAKAGIAAAAVAAAAVGAVAIASKAKKTSEGANVDPKGAAKLIKQAGAAIKREAGIAGETAKYAAKRAGKKIKGAFKKKANESFLSSLAFGLEGVMVDGDDIDDDEVEPMDGKAFDDEDLIETATEAAIAVMMLEDGIDDSDIE